MDAESNSRLEPQKSNFSSKPVSPAVEKNSDEIKLAKQEDKAMANEQTTKGSAKVELNPEQPFDSKVSEKKFSGNWIPYHNAKVIKEAIDSGNAPFLPDKDGIINAKPIFNANTGYCLGAKDLIPLQIEQKEGFSPVVVTKNTVDAAKTKIKANEKGFFYNFKRNDGTYGTTQFFFPEQTEHPERVIEKATEKIEAANKNSRIYENQPRETITITSANPEEYFAKYIAACKTNSVCKCEPAIAEEFKKNLDVVIQNQFAKYTEKNPDIGKLNGLLFEADKKSLDVVKSVRAEQKKQMQIDKPKHSQEVAQDLAF